MRKVHLLTAFAITLLWPTAAAAGQLKGPGRFCGYSPIIDLVEGESITTLEGGIHSGSFRWDGPFGSLLVHGIGWASKPPGLMLRKKTSTGRFVFAQRETTDGFTVAIWNGKQGAAYFRSPQPLNKAQLRAIDRVDLFQETLDENEKPRGCKLSTIFVLE